MVETKGHPHAHLMKQYAEDAMTNSEAWKLWEMYCEWDKAWKRIIGHPAWCIDTEYRRRISQPTPEAAIEHAKALIEVSGGTV